MDAGCFRIFLMRVWVAGAGRSNESAHFDKFLRAHFCAVNTRAVMKITTHLTEKKHWYT